MCDRERQRERVCDRERERKREDTKRERRHEERGREMVRKKTFAKRIWILYLIIFPSN